jgi:hypothetical protein
MCRSRYISKVIDMRHPRVSGFVVYIGSRGIVKAQNRLYRRSQGEAPQILDINDNTIRTCASMILVVIFNVY